MITFGYQVIIGTPKCHKCLYVLEELDVRSYLLRSNCSVAPILNHSSSLALQINQNRTVQVAITLWRTGCGTIWIRLHPECLLVNRLHGAVELVIDTGEGRKGVSGNEIILGPSQTVAMSLTAEVRQERVFLFLFATHGYTFPPLASFLLFLCCRIVWR